VKWSGNRVISSIRALSADTIVKEISYGNSGSTSGVTRINLALATDITIEAVDTYGYKYSNTLTPLPGTDILPIDPGTSSQTGSKTPPTITMINPK
jgi:hypothetical protein